MEGNPSRCAPPPVAVSVAGNRLLEEKKTVAPVRQPFVFRIQSSRSYRGVVESDCTVLFRDGSYHSERSSQELGENRKDQISDGQLTSAAMEAIASILGADELVSRSRNQNTNPPPFAQEGTFTLLSVPRDTKIQNLAFSTSFNTLTTPNEVGGRSNMNYQVSDEKLLDPLRKWMKVNIPHNQFQNGAGSNCGIFVPKSSLETKAN